MHIIPLLVMTRIIFAHQVFSIIMCQGSCPMLLVGTFHAWKYDSHPFPWNTISDKRQAGWETGIDFYGNTVTSASQPTMGQSGWHLANNLFPLLHIKGRCIFEHFKYAEIWVGAQFVSVICREAGFARCLSSLWAFAASGTSQACCNFNSWFQHAKHHNSKMGSQIYAKFYSDWLLWGQLLYFWPPNTLCRCIQIRYILWVSCSKNMFSKYRLMTSDWRQHYCHLW